MTDCIRIGVMVLASACERGEAPPPTVAPQPAAREHAVGVADPVPCDDLAARYCQALPLPCRGVRAVVEAAGASARRCAGEDAELASLRAGAGADVHAAAAAESLQRLIDDSPLSARQVDDLLAGEVSSTGRGEAAQLQCPEGTTPRGDVPPDGHRRWCEGADGLPHGPVLAWNGRGELVQRGRYRRGHLVHAGFVVPESRDLPPEAFTCPEGTDVRDSTDGAQQAKWCEREDGAWHGPAIIWEGGLVTRFAVWEDGTQTRAFGLAPP